MKVSFFSVERVVLIEGVVRLGACAVWTSSKCSVRKNWWTWL